MEPKIALARRLAAYSATAGVTLAVTPQVEGQIVYHDFEPDLVLSQPGGEIHLDLDGSGDSEFIFYHAVDNYNYTRAVFMDGLIHHDDVLVYDPFQPDLGTLSRLNSGEVVGTVYPPHAFVREGILAEAYLSGGPRPQFQNRMGYAGFRFLSNNARVHYGWIRISVQKVFFRFTTTVYEYAYQFSPLNPIITGDRGLAMLEGAVSPTTFPAEGGVLTFAFTLTNASGAASSFDLWLDADHGGFDLPRHLDTYTLPDGGTVADIVTVEVPPELPEGTYNLTFKAGDFGAGTALVWHPFTITKGLATAAEPGPPQSPFALTAPAPNPSTGHPRFALTVAHTQHVRVAVHDALGREVALLHDGALAAGTAHAFTFDGSALPAGVYVVRVVGEDFADVRTFTLVR